MCMEVYKPHESNDERFAAYRDLNITFVSGIAGWCWSARNAQDETVSESCFLGLDLAIENALEVLAGTPVFKPNPFKSQTPSGGRNLENFLKDWTEKYG